MYLENTSLLHWWLSFKRATILIARERHFVQNQRETEYFSNMAFFSAFNISIIILEKCCCRNYRKQREKDEKSVFRGFGVLDVRQPCTSVEIRNKRGKKNVETSVQSWVKLLPARYSRVLRNRQSCSLPSLSRLFLLTRQLLLQRFAFTSSACAHVCDISKRVVIVATREISYGATRRGKVSIFENRGRKWRIEHWPRISFRRH